MTEAKCPRCNSPSPELHPAVQHEGEVQPCLHPWHNQASRGGPGWQRLQRWKGMEAFRLETVRQQQAALNSVAAERATHGDDQRFAPPAKHTDYPVPTKGKSRDQKITRRRK